MKRYFFDLDGTIADTSDLEIYRKTGKAAIKYLFEHPQKITIRADENILNLVNYLGKHAIVKIITNAGKGYAEEILKRCGLSSEIKILFDLNKPKSEKLRSFLGNSNSKNTLIIGDSASDIMAGHGCRIPAAGLFSGYGYSSEEQLSKAEPIGIASNAKELERIINNFESEKIEYRERKDPENYDYLKSKPKYNLEMNPTSINDYYPMNKYPKGRNPKMGFARMVFRFETAKDHSIEDIENGLLDEYVWNGERAGWNTYKAAIEFFHNKCIDKISSMNLGGETKIIASTNSAPEYCYKFDINHHFVKGLNKEISKVWDSERKICRVFPQEKKTRDAEVQMQTMGVRKNSKIPSRVSNVIIFDDVYTTGSQTKAMAYLLREVMNFQGNIYTLTIGKTVN